ncbi:MAG: UvrD-helicase domain-containing protein [Oscillatoria sp. SIO1A7]|nr:UvrD-helicase domain-containing protein [Oscillatoria sp. SIO1A7]
MALTPEQQKAAHARGSVTVTAGAGTGKTHTLTERYLYLLSSRGLSPLDIVACTFTDKAAAELRSRVRLAVSQQLPDSQRGFGKLLAELEAAQISTIHALATRVCQQHPEAAGVPPDFSVLDDLEGRLWLNQQLALALDKLPQRIYREIPYSLLSSTLRALLADPIAAERALAGSASLTTMASQLQNQGLAQLLQNSAWKDAVNTLYNFAGERGDRREEARQTAIAVVQEIGHGALGAIPAHWALGIDRDLAQSESESNLEAKTSKLKTQTLKLRTLNLERLAAINLRGGSAKRWPDGGFEEIRDAIASLKKLAERTIKQGLVSAETGATDEKLAAMLPSLQEAFALVRDAIAEAKRAARVLDFADLEVHALRALQSPEVRFYYRQRWRAFLVDEFQDTNPVQGEIMELLAGRQEEEQAKPADMEPAILTIVGDAKQSIYGFRRADVTVFRNWRDRILSTGGEEVVLSTSFRSHGLLLEKVNRVFAPLLGELHQNLNAYRTDAPFEAEADGDRRDIFQGDGGPYLRAYAVKASKGINIDRCRRAEAIHIARTLEELLDNEVTVHDKNSDSLRPITPGDIAILSRTWEPLEFYGETLESIGIPVVLLGGGSLLETREAKDMWAMLRFLADSNDDLALAAILRSPFFAISDRVLAINFGGSGLVAHGGSGWVADGGSGWVADGADGGSGWVADGADGGSGWVADGADGGSGWVADGADGGSGWVADGADGGSGWVADGADGGSGLVADGTDGGSGWVADGADGGSGLVADVADGGSGWVADGTDGGSGLVADVADGGSQKLGDRQKPGFSKLSWWERIKKLAIPELQRPVEVLEELLRERATEPPTRLLQLADRLTGYTAVIANLPGAERREADWRGFMGLVRQLEGGMGDVFEVVRRLRQLVAGEVAVPRLPLEARNAVTLMTIHAAKGLEWPVVVVPDLTRSRPTISPSVYFDPSQGVALRIADEEGNLQKPVLYLHLEKLRQEREEAEAKRLLYVALTRARDRLILTAASDRGSALDLLRPGLAAAGIEIETIPFTAEDVLPPTPPLPPIKESYGELLGSVGSGLFELPVTALSDYAACPKKFKFRFLDGHPGAGEAAAIGQRLGTLVHLALERDIRSVETLSLFDLSLEREYVAEAISLCLRWDELPVYAPYRKGDTIREQGLNLTIEGLSLVGVVDLLGKDFVLDFKSDRERVPHHHRFQLWAYARATERPNAHIAYLRHSELYTYSPDYLQEVGEEARALVKDILAGDYPPRPWPANCNSCPYTEICADCYQPGESATAGEDMPF